MDTQQREPNEVLFKPVKNQKVYQQVVEQIQAMVLDGTLKVGDRLPSERSLSEQLSISRASVREALRALEIIGIVDSRQGEGSFIRSPLDREIFEPLSVVFKLNKGTFREILEYRTIFEPQAAALAAQRIDAEGASVLRDLAQRMQRSHDDAKSSDIDQTIHSRIVSMAGNYLLEITQNATNSVMQAFIREARDYLIQWHENRQQLVELHVELCEAVASGDADRARKASQRHFAFIIDNIRI